MSPQLRQMTGIPLVVLPAVIIDGGSLLLLLFWDPEYAAIPLRQDL